MMRLTAELKAHLKEAAQLDQAIERNLKELGYGE
jgi:hypothetical protein